MAKFDFFYGGVGTKQTKIPTTNQYNFTPLLMTVSQGFILPTAAESVCLCMLSDKYPLKIDFQINLSVSSNAQLMGIQYTVITHSQIEFCIHKNRKWTEIKSRQSLKNKCSFTILNANSSFY